jgi:hypothetical protein
MPIMNSIEQGGQPQPEERDLTKTVSKLRVLSPLRMGSIQFALERRTVFLESTQRLDEEYREGAISPFGESLHFRDRDYLWRQYEHEGGKIVNEVLDGVRNPVTGNLWSDVLIEIAKEADELFRSELYVELLLEKEESIFAKKRIGRVLETT